MEANFSLFFGLGVQAYEQLTIPDDTPWDRFNDENPLIGNGVAQPGEQGTLPIFSSFDPLGMGCSNPAAPPDCVPGIREAVTGDPTGDVTLVDGFGPDELFGFDIFAGGNLTAALEAGGSRNPTVSTADNPLGALGVGSNPFIRTARCALCHLGPEQSDHTNNVNAGLLQSGTEQEFPFPRGSGEPTGVLRVVMGVSLAEELEENAQDGVEVENRNFDIVDDELDDPDTPFPIDESMFDDAQMGAARGIAFQDNGVYNIGLRPTDEDLLRGGDDPFGFPLALAALALKNLGGADYEPCDTPTDVCDGPLPNFDPDLGVGGGLFEEVGEGFPFDGTGPTDCDGGPCEQESINPGFETEPEDPLLPSYLAPWANNLPAGEGHPQTDELAFAPNTVTPPPSPEYGEILFGSDLHCGAFAPGVFGAGPPNFGWGAVDPVTGLPVLDRCPQSQSGVPSNSPARLSDEADRGRMEVPLNGTWPFENRVARNGAAKVPHLRNVEKTGPYFHTGSVSTLAQVVEFYMRGGDFPITNAEDRDPNLVDIDVQAFGFGSTLELPPEFQDGVPDGVAQYGLMPDSDPPGCVDEPSITCTPEPDTTTRDEARDALVKFLIALTDQRVVKRIAPFDQPEIFPPLDGRAPENTGGRTQLLALSVTKTDGIPKCNDVDPLVCPNPDAGGVPAVPCGPGHTEFCFLQVPATGRTGQADPLQNFLEISSTPQNGPHNDHFDTSHVQGKFGSQHAGGKKKKKK